MAPEAKAAARENIVKALKTGFGDREVLVRINGLDTRWWVDDIDAAASASLTPSWCRKCRPPSNCRTWRRGWSTWAPIRACASGR